MRKEGRSRKGIQGGGARLSRIWGGGGGWFGWREEFSAQSGRARDPLKPDCSSSSKQKQDRKEATANNSSPGKGLFPSSPALAPAPALSLSPTPK